MWPKLQEPEFTTFRFPRKDKDWYVGEVVQLVFKPRSEEREVLGTAEIVRIGGRWIFTAIDNRCLHLSEKEAIADGFPSKDEMRRWLRHAYGITRLIYEPMNKLTLRKGGE